MTRLLESYKGHEDPHVFVWWKGCVPSARTSARARTDDRTGNRSSVRARVYRSERC